MHHPDQATVAAVQAAKTYPGRNLRETNSGPEEGEALEIPAANQSSIEVL